MAEHFWNFPNRMRKILDFLKNFDFFPVGKIFLIFFMKFFWKLPRTCQNVSKCAKNQFLIVLGRVEVPDIAYGWCISHTVHARWFGGTSYCGLTIYNDFSMIICTLGRGSADIDRGEKKLSAEKIQS